MSEGRLYEVDMRLRPSGRQGPVATSLVGFESYQLNEAWTWEHLALTRARGIVGDEDFLADIERVRRSVLAEKAGGKSVLSDVADMRARISEARPGTGGLEVKAGRGRLQEIELAAQTIALQNRVAQPDVSGQVQGGVASGALSDADGQALIDAAALFWQVQAAGRLLNGGAGEAQTLGEGGQRFLLRETGCRDMTELLSRLDTLSDAAGAAFDRILEVGK